MKVIDFEVRIDTINEDVKRLYQILRPETKLEDIKFNEFNEGVVNSMVKVDDLINNDPLVIRSHGLKINAARKETKEEGANEKEEFDITKLQNKKLELAALKASSDLGITVKLVAIYTNGFVYKYINGDVNDAKLYDLDVAKQTAIKMAKLHKIELKGLASEIPMLDKSTEDGFANTFKEKFDQMQSQSIHKEFREDIPLFSFFIEESKKLYEMIKDHNGLGKTCFCHNDLNMGNLLIEKSTKEPIFIDFEWSDTCYNNYDIAYHLYNMGGRFCGYFNPEDVPKEDVIRKWLTFYYQETHKLDGIEISDKEFNDLIENELQKILVCMIYIALLLIERAMFFAFDFAKDRPTDSIKDYCLSIYKDYIKRKEEHLKLLETIKK